MSADKPVSCPENPAASSSPQQHRGWAITRRAFITTMGAAVIGPFLAYQYATRIEPHWLRVRRRPMAIKGLSAALEGRTLLHLSDLHIGPRVEPDYLARALQMARDLKPDLVAITGDLIDRDFPVAEETAWAALQAFLDALPVAPLGRFAVLGNHDYGLNWSNYRNADRLVAEYEHAGVQVLRNKTTALMHGLQIVGIDDAWAKRVDMEAAFKDCNAVRPAVVLVHNPDVCDWSGWPAALSGWVLAGHTHGGQCKPPFLPPPLLPVENRRYTRGVFDLAGGLMLHISPGVGYVTKARLNCRPELVLFTLRAG